jgi:hypothetical protein
MLLAYDLVDHSVYQLYETNPDVSIQVWTHRSVNSTYECSNFFVTEGADGKSPNVTYQIVSGNETAKLYIGGDPSPGATVYVTEVERTCGPRCAMVWGFQSIVPDSGLDQSCLCRCNVSISPVSDTDKPEQKLPDRVAQIGAGAIGLDGYDSVSRPLTQNNRSHSRYVQTIVPCL